MKHSDYLKKKKARETRKKIISVIAAFVVFVTTYALVLPAITLDVSRANKEPGIAFEQMQFKASASAAAVTAAENTDEEAAVEVKAEETQVEETKEEAPEKEEAPAEEPAPAKETEESKEEASAEAAPAEEAKETVEEAPAETAEEEAPAEDKADTNADQSAVKQEDEPVESAQKEENKEAASNDASTSNSAESNDAAAVDQTSTGTAETAESAAAATTEAATEFQIPEKDPLDFDEILTGKTDFYFYHVENAEEAENLSSDSVDDWKKVNSDTVLAPEDFVRVYLSYEIPAGALNETNPVARYTLPKGLELSDKQIEAINKYENGVAAAKSGSEHDQYLGAEAIEGDRTPDEKAGDENISATVKVDKVHKDGEDRQELVFTFIPYTVEKNQTGYDEVGEVISEGKKVKGFFAFDLTTSQIDFEKTNVETIENEDGTSEDIQYSEAKVVFVKENNDKDIDEISRTLILADAVEKTEETKEQKNLKYEGADYTVTVTYTDDAEIPENSELKVREIDKEQDAEEYASYLEQAQAAVDQFKAVNEARFFDITIYSGEEKIEPKAPVGVQINFTGIEQTNTDDTQLLHYKDDKEVEVMDKAEFSKSEEAGQEKGKDKAVDTVQFEAEGFSVYAIVATETIKTQVITADGETYEIAVTYGPDAGVPEEADLIVSEITEESEEFQKYKEQTAGAVGTETEALNYVKLLDISIMNGDEKVVIQAPVEVQIKLLDKKNTEETTGEKTKVVHFGEDTTDVIEPDVEGTTVNFETEGFSYYAVTTYGATSDLGRKSYAIVQVNTQASEAQSTGNNTKYPGRALTTTAQSSNTRLGGATVSVETHESGKNLVTSGTTEIVQWEFEAAGNNTYYIKAPNGQYLNLSNQNNNNYLRLTDSPTALTVTAGTGNNAGKVLISNGNRRVQSSATANSGTASSNQYFYNGNSDDANYVYLTLCEIEEFDPDQYPAYYGEKISVQNLGDGGSYIIYKNIYNELTGQYEDWVIDGNGNPVRAYDQGDSLSLHSEISPMWVLHICKNNQGQPTGYYIFRNEQTGLCLCPQADGTLVAAYESDTTSGVALSGREKGEYSSTIEKWDDSAMHWYGYEITADGEVKISSVTGNASQAFSFAEYKDPDAPGLHEVETVDSETAGITIHMFNYPNRDVIANVTGSNSYAVGVLPDQHVAATLNTDGYPVFTNGNNGSTLFNPDNNYYKGTGNHLFLESVYDSTGYYEYSAFNNFAHYNSDGTFTVYEETGTPSPTSSNFFYRRGNFFPYNNLDTSKSAQNIYTGDGTIIDYQNPSYGGTLYGFDKDPDYYFGMTMEFNFLMPKDGYEKGSPLIYEFNGDDDLWIYIDDVLILDIGGVHDAFPGTINFATGDIIGGNGGAGGATTIKECFHNAGVFPDGTEWDDSKVDQYFAGETFVNYGSHKFNMFYMEHGAGASNLQTRFNLPVIEKGKVTVEKKLDNTSQVDYANVSFAYQAFAKNEEGEYQLLTNAVYEGKTDDNGNPVSVTFYDNVTIDGKIYNSVFYLKPEEAAVFSDILEDEMYYVQEIGIKSEYYDEIFVNDVKIDGTTVDAQNGIYKSSEATARNRARVTFTNHCDARNSNELTITKRLSQGSEDNGDTFEFRVMLENASGVLSAYYQGTYYIRDDDGVYYKYQNGQLTPNGQTPYALTAGNFGTIAQIPPDYTVVITDLVAGTDFYVDEIRVRPNGSSSNVLLGASDWILESTVTTECDDPDITDASIYDYATGSTKTGSALGKIAWDKDANVTFTNKAASLDIQLKKVKEDGTTTISGSTFDLTKYANDVWSNNVQTNIKPGEAATETTPAVPNPVDLGELPIGKYRLTETKAPDGYLILTKHVYFEIYKDTDGVIKARWIDENGTALTDDQITEFEKTAKLTSTTTDDGTVYTVTIINTPGASLPHTGGPGTFLYTLGGMMLLIASAMMYGFRMRRRERRLN